MIDRWIVVTNWDKHQHRDAGRRRGGLLWHKVYSELLTDDDYLGLSLSQRGLLHGLWTMRAQSERISEHRARTVLGTQRGTSRAHELRHFREHIEALEQAGWIQIVASRPARSPASEPASVEVEVEKKEKEPRAVTSTENPRANGQPQQQPHDSDIDFDNILKPMPTA